MTSKIIAVGGNGGFSAAPGMPSLVPYCLSQTGKLGQTGKQAPKVCFIPTASGDSEDYIARFEAAFEPYECVRSLLTFFRPPRENSIPLADMEAHLQEQDLIYVGGGNTQTMLAVWREWHLNHILREVWQSGVLLAGVSAGALCWFECGGSDSSYAGELSALRGIGLISGSCTPHYSNEANRRPDVHRLMERGELPAGIGLDDGVAALFEDTKLVEVVASRAEGKAYRVELEYGKAVEKPLEVRYLDFSV